MKAEDTKKYMHILKSYRKIFPISLDSNYKEKEKKSWDAERRNHLRSSTEEPYQCVIEECKVCGDFITKNTWCKILAKGNKSDLLCKVCWSWAMRMFKKFKRR